MALISKRSALSFVLVVLLFIPQRTRPIYVAQNNNHVGEYLTYALTAAAIFSGLLVVYKVADWLFTKTNEQVLEQANNDKQSIGLIYGNMLSILCTDDRPIEVGENRLKGVADQLIGQDVGQYRLNLKVFIAQLESDAKTLSSRAKSLSREKSTDESKNIKNSEIAEEMLRLSQAINREKGFLDYLYRVMSENKRYFELHKEYGNALVQYQDVFDLYCKPAVKDDKFYTMIKGAVILCLGNEEKDYPCLISVKRMQQDSRQLKQAATKCPLAYSLVEESNNVASLLLELVRVLTISEQYAVEKKDRRLFDEKRKQTQELQRQTKAQEQLAREAERKNNLKEKELRQKKADGAHKIGASKTA